MGEASLTENHKSDIGLCWLLMLNSASPSFGKAHLFVRPGWKLKPTHVQKRGLPSPRMSPFRWGSLQNPPSV